MPALMRLNNNNNNERKTTMKKTMTTSDIAHELIDDGNANWSRAGAFALAEYLEELEESTGEEMEFDHVAIRCDFSEYADLETWLSEYYSRPIPAAYESAGIDLDGEEDEEEKEEWIRSHIQDHGTLIEFDGGIIVSSF
jgi:hypothetical protein